MSESNWIKHLMGLAKLEKNIGKKVAFESSADMIKNLEQELATLKASLPKIKADAASNYLEYLEYCKRISIDNPTEPLEYLAGLEKLEAGE